MTKNVDDILKELIAIEPSFAAHREEMRTLIAELLAKKPDTQLDAQFVLQLRARLVGKSVVSPYSRYVSYIPYVVAVLAVIVAIPYGMQYLQQSSSGSPVFAMNQQIQNVGSNAYGELAPQESGKGGLGGVGMNAAPTAAAVPAADTAVQSSNSFHAETTAGSAPVATMAVAPTSGAVNTATVASPPTATKMVAGYGGGANARMMLPQGPVTVYDYVYKGDPLDLSADGLVYSRVTGQNSSGQVAAQLRKFNFGLINLGAYADARVQSFQLVQDKPFGYSIGVSFDDGSININPNYPQWPSLSGKEPYTSLPMSAMLKDTEIIAIANQFLKDQDISLANYGDPIVQQYAEAIAATTEGGGDTQQSAPDQMTVVYPLRIQGTLVYEDGASPYGLQVGVSIRDKKVMSVYGLTSQTYTSSSYKLVTDSQKITDSLAKGGPHAWVPQASDGIQIKKVDIEVGTPTKVLMHTYSYKDNSSQELYVPALSFPVLTKPQSGEYYPQNIIVPLVPELLDQAQGGPIPYDAVR